MMSTIQTLIADHIDIWTAADTEKKSGRGRSSGNAASVYGIRKLRELILELAVRGKLVPQDPSDEPASELLKRILAEKAKLIAEGKIKKAKSLAITDDEKPFDLPLGWEWTKLVFISLINPRNSAEDNSPTSFVPMAMIGSRFNSSHDQEARLWKEIKQGFTHFAEGDIGVAKITPCFENSKACVFSGLLSGIGAGTTELHIVRPINATLAPRYVLAYLKSPQFLLVGETKMTGTAGQKRLPKDFVESNPFPLPPLAEQHRIVAKVDELMMLCDQLETQHGNAAEAHEKLVSHLLGTLRLSPNPASPLCKRGGGGDLDWQRIAAHFDILFTTEASIEALKQTLLQLAVMGKLVPQDPNDEPVSELLKRIQVEKAKLIAEGKIKKAKSLAPITNDEKPFPSPHGWQWVKFDHVTENSKYALKAGPFGSALKKDMYSESGYKIYGQEQVISGDENLGDYFIDNKKFQQLSSCAVKPGDILISLVGTIGRVLVLSENCGLGIINPRLVKISLFKEIDRSYFKVIFASPLLRNEMADRSHGGTMNILNLGLLRELALPLPPIEEQHRIVAKVDELMAICDQLKARITKANQLQQKLADVVVEQAIL